jgi:hypothetical protein
MREILMRREIIRFKRYIEQYLIHHLFDIINMDDINGEISNMFEFEKIEGVYRDSPDGYQTYTFYIQPAVAVEHIVIDFTIVSSGIINNPIDNFKYLK